MSENKSGKLVLFDFDNVIYRGYSTIDIIRAQEKDGFIQTGVWDSTEEQLQKYKEQKISYKEAANKILEAWAKGLRGRNYQDTVTYVEGYFKNNPNKFFTWFDQALSIFKRHKIFIITSSYQFIAEVVVGMFDLHGYISSEAEVNEGIFTGMVGKSLAGNKGEVNTLLKRYSQKGSIAVGDSEDDIDMLEKVETPICFQPDEKLKNIASSKGWLVINESSALIKLRDITKPLLTPMLSKTK